MKAKPLKIDKESINKGYVECEIGEVTHIQLNLPGPIPTRILPVILKGSRKDTGCWSWNGDINNPTIKPSIRTQNGVDVCHTWINDGKVQFLDDCTHELAGQTLDLLEVE